MRRRFKVLVPMLFFFSFAMGCGGSEKKDDGKTIAPKETAPMPKDNPTGAGAK